jgi:hypothetical protein
MEQPYQNRQSNFGKLGKEIVERRLTKLGLEKSAYEFFPVNPAFEQGIKECEEEAQKQALLKYPKEEKKKIADFVYKYARADYFRKKAGGKSNTPPYSGFDIILHISTGVIRNLLEPCYWMYDLVYSELSSGGDDNPKIDQIPPPIQSRIIEERSIKKWDWIRSGLDDSVEGCSRIQAQQIYNLFDNLAIHFRERLLHHPSEPRAINFTISEESFEHTSDLLALLKIAQRAQLLYTYSSSAKDLGKKEIYYVPNRMLWPSRGLDPQGQHARVSLRARVLWEAASKNKSIPFDKKEESLNMELFHE